MLLSLHSFLSPPFPSSFPKSDLRLLCFLGALSPSPGPLPHIPQLLYCPPAALLPHILPPIVLVPPSILDGCGLSGWPSALCSWLPGGLQLVYSPLSTCTPPDSGQGIHSAPSPWQLPPHSSLTARFLTTGAPSPSCRCPGTQC